jgi:hypothetical protein
MKVMNLFLVGVVLLLGFACAEVNDTNVSFENNTVVLNGTVVMNGTIVLNETVEVNETIVLNETIIANETVMPNETIVQNEIIVVNETVAPNETVEDLEVDDIIIEDELEVIKKKSASSVVFSYVSDVIDRVNAVHQNLFYIILIVLWILLLFLHSLFYGKKSAGTCFTRASSLHRRAQKAHVNGDYAKAKKLYSKSYSLREEGESKADSEL